MATVHFVYNKGIQLKTPERILYELAERLAKRYPLATYDARERITIRPQTGDILIGHPSRYVADSLFNRSFKQPGWARRIVFCPFSHGMPCDAASIDPLVEEADFYLALCGPYWFDTVQDSVFSHWHYKMMRCDLGVNRRHYPQIKRTFNPAGRRRFVYIGNAGPMKGVDFFCHLAEANPSLDFGWIGWIGDSQRPSGTLRRDYARIERRLQSRAITVHGGADWRDQNHLETITGYDFLVTCGRSDSNPTTILESAAWGLIPVATMQCGYYGDDWLINIPLDNVEGASRVLQHLNCCADDELMARRESGFRQLDAKYTWDHAAQQVMDCIEAPPPVMPDDAAWLKTKRRNQTVLRDIVRRYRRDQAVEDILHTIGRLPRRTLGKIAQFARGAA